MTPEQRSQRARIAALSRWSREDAAAGTKKARDAFLARFLDDVDINRELSEDERNRRAIAARKAHMARLSYRSAKLRSSKKAAS